MEIKLRMLEEGPQVNTHLDGLKATLKKIVNWKPNQAVIRTLGEKETYKCLEILEVDTIKHVEMKEEIKKKSITEELENFLGLNSLAGTLSKE